jgi:cytochrome c biogenesis protein CcdA
MATNVAAITFIAHRLSRLRYVLLSGMFYTIGQALAYVILGMILVSSLGSGPLISHWLQKYMIRLLGPILILGAIFLLELIEVQFGRGRLKQWGQKWASTGGLGGTAILGVIFGMSFCPTTAALFFGGLVPLAIKQQSPVLLPFMYAIGVALPVWTFALIIAFAANKVGKIFERVGRAEWWARRATGAIFLALGLWFTLAYTIDVI